MFSTTLPSQICEVCGNQTLRDTIVNFGNTVEEVPSMESQYDSAWVQCIKSDLMVALGTSLSVSTSCACAHIQIITIIHTHTNIQHQHNCQIIITGELVDECIEQGENKGRLVIVNNQRTLKDHLATLIIRAPCDHVVTLLMHELNLEKDR